MHCRGSLGFFKTVTLAAAYLAFKRERGHLESILTRILSTSIDSASSSNKKMRSSCAPTNTAPRLHSVDSGQVGVARHLFRNSMHSFLFYAQMNLNAVTFNSE